MSLVVLGFRLLNNLTKRTRVQWEFKVKSKRRGRVQAKLKWLNRQQHVFQKASICLWSSVSWMSSLKLILRPLIYSDKEMNAINYYHDIKNVFRVKSLGDLQLFFEADWEADSSQCWKSVKDCAPWDWLTLFFAALQASRWRRCLTTVNTGR